MAKRKQRKRTGPGRAAAGSATATTGRTGRASKAPVAPAPVKPAPATPGGPNRLERKEAARAQRERMRRKMVRRRMYRRATIGLVVVAAIAGIVFASTRPKGSPLNAEETRLLREAPQALSSAGCGDVVKTKDYPDDQDRTHISQEPGPALSTYPTVPPASGPHNSVPLSAGVYQDPPDVYRTIHSLEHAAVIIWYSPTAGTNSQQADELAKLQQFFNKASEQTKVIVAPYNYPDQGKAGQLPEGKNMVLVAWHRVRTCDQVSLAAAYDFVAHYRSPAPKGQKYLGVAPEPTAGI